MRRRIRSRPTASQSLKDIGFQVREFCKEK